jgi:hypothetical protein
MMLPLMATSLLGYAVSRMVCQHPVYHAIAHSMVLNASTSEGLALPHGRASAERHYDDDEDESPEKSGTAAV